MGCLNPPLRVCGDIPFPIFFYDTKVQMQGGCIELLHGQVSALFLLQAVATGHAQ